MKGSDPNPVYFEFSGFSFDLLERVLYRGNEKISMPPKTCDLLAVLLESNGRLLTKEVIFEKVWADVVVEEANLSHHIAVLRKTLGEERNGRKFIETVPRRGYRFVAAVTNGVSAETETVELTFTAQSRTETIMTSTEETNTVDRSLSDQESKFQNRKRFFYLFGLLICCVSVAVWYFATWSRAFSTGLNSQNSRSVSAESIRVSDKNVSISAISPDGRFIASAQNSNIVNGGGLYIRQLETNRELTLLEPDNERVFADMKFSFDGSLVYFIAFEKNSGDGAIYRIPFLGGPRQKLVELNDNSSSFAVSPENREIAIFRAGINGDEVVSVPVDNPAAGERTLLRFDRSRQNFGGFLAWSPDGKFISLSADQPIADAESKTQTRLFILDVASGDLRPASNETFESIGKQVFSPDGTEVYCVAKRSRTTQTIYGVNLVTGRVRSLLFGTNPTGFFGFYGLSVTADGKTLSGDVTETRADVWISELNGENARRVKAGTVDGKRGLCALPDGQILYTATANGRSDIWKMRDDGTDIQPLTNDEFIERNLVATSDGKYVVFSSNAGGGWHLFRLKIDNPTEVKQLTFGQAIDRQPDISPDDQSIAYISEENGRVAIKRTTLDGAPSIVLNDTEDAVFPVFSPDGRKIAFEIVSSMRSLPGTIAIMPVEGGKVEKRFPVADFNFRDMTNPLRWTPDGTGILFSKINTEISNLWRLDLLTSRAEPLTKFNDEGIYNFVLSADKKKVYFSRGLYVTNTLLIRDFGSSD